MFFRSRKKLINKTGKEHKALPAALPLKCGCRERMSSHLSLKAGLTVETACILPLFLWAVIGIFYLIEMSAVETRLVGGIRDTGRKMAVLAYGIYGGESDGEKEIGVGEVVEGALTAMYARSQILEKANLGETALEGETWISLGASDFSDKNMIDLKITSRIQIPVPFFNIRKFQFMERGRVRAWTGRTPTETEENSDGEEVEMVYVTSTGTVYHRSAECTYIKLSISSGTVSSVGALRNTSGGKYYPCSCYQAHPSETVYYTKTGTRYHSSLGCKNMKRTVRKVELSSVSGLRPCSKCG